MTRICSPSARLATTEPMLPQPMTPSTLPVISTPMKRDLLPLAGLRRLVGGGDLPGAGEEHRDGVLGRRDRIAERRVHHDDARRRRGGDVDVVDADAGAADDAQPAVRGGDHLRRHLGGGADGQAVELADDSLRASPCRRRASGWKSTSTPRSRKTLTAVSDRLSEMRTRGVIVETSLALRQPDMMGGGPACRPALTRPCEGRPWRVANAQSSHGSSAARFACSTVAPHQILRPGGASR